MKKWLRRKFINWLVQDLFLGVQKDEVFQVKGKTIYVAGEPLTPGQIDKLAKEAKTLQNMAVWELLRKELQYHAYDRGWKKAQTDDDMLVGKLLLYYEDLINSKLHDIATKWYNTNKGYGNR